MKAPPTSTRRSRTARLASHQRDRWPDLESIEVRFRAKSAYVDGYDGDRSFLRLCRLHCGGSASLWGLRHYRASHGDDQTPNLRTGIPVGSPEATPTN
jgi:hypothetical protein